MERSLLTQAIAAAVHRVPPSGEHPILPVPAAAIGVSSLRFSVAAPSPASAGRQTERAGRPAPTTSTPGPLRPRALAQLAVELEVDALVEEAEVVADVLRVVLGARVRPDEVVVPAAGGVEVPVRGRALVRAARLLRARHEQLGADVLGRQVVARRQPGLEQDLRAPRVGDDLAVDEDANVPRRLPDVDPAVGV